MKRTAVLPGGAKLVQKGKPKYKFDLTIDSDEQIEKDMNSFARSLRKMSKREVINYAVSCFANWNYSMNDRNRALKKVRRLEALLTQLKILKGYRGPSRLRSYKPGSFSR